MLSHFATTSSQREGQRSCPELGFFRVFSYRCFLFLQRLHCPEVRDDVDVGAAG